MGGGFDQEMMGMECDDKKSILNPGVLLFDRFNGQLWQMCPLDKTHYCRKKFLRDHIEECKQRCLRGPRKVECPFNPLHIVNLMEIAEHIMMCENRVVQTNSLCDFEPKRETIEGVAMAPLNVAIRIPNTWEDGKNPDYGYDAMDATKFRAVIRPPPPGMTKKMKRAWKMGERERFSALLGPAREKPRASPYPTPHQIKQAKSGGQQVSGVREGDADIEGIIDKLGSANIGDPRDAMMKRINARLKVLRVMEEKLKEEKLELQRQVEQYLESIGKIDPDVSVKNEPKEYQNTARKNLDPRLVSGQNDNERPRSLTPNHIPRFLRA